MGKAKKRLAFVALAVVLILVLFASLIGFISDFLWFREMGYLSVFFKKLITQITVGIPTFIVVTGLVYLYLNRIRKDYFSKIASSEATDVKKLRKVTIALAVLFGVFSTGMSVMQLWFEILKFSNSTSFDLADPLFNIDISFYIFRLDFLSQLNEILIGVIVGFILLTVIYYIILMTVRTPDVFKDEVPSDAQPADGEERYTGNSNPFGGKSGSGNDFFGKFAEAFTGKKYQSKPVRPKRSPAYSSYPQR